MKESQPETGLRAEQEAQRLQRGRGGGEWGVGVRPGSGGRVFQRIWG